MVALPSRARFEAGPGFLGQLVGAGAHGPEQARGCWHEEADSPEDKRATLLDGAGETWALSTTSTLLAALGRLAVMHKIVLPLALPGVAVAGMFTFVFTWNEYLYALILTQVRAVTAPVALSKMIGAYSIEWGDLSAAIIVQLIPMIAVVFLLQRHISRGLGLGAVR